MIFLFTALYAEAKPLIEHWHLKRKEGPIQQFENGEITLTVTGTGPIAAASVGGAVLGKKPRHADDFLISAGICAGLSHQKKGSIVLIHQLIDQNSGRAFYPDIIFTSLKREETLFTGSRVWNRESSVADHGLYDMEGAALFEAGSLFLSPHQMRFLKTVSDTGDTLVTPQEVSGLMKELIPSLEAEIEAMRRQCAKEEEVLIENEEETADLFQASLTMRRQIHQLLLYCTLAGTDWKAVIQQKIKQGLLPAENRSEGKKRLEEIRHELIG